MHSVEANFAVSFSPAELQLAQELKTLGLAWTPGCGQYVLDLCHLIECDSPFEGRVFYILELKHFLRRAQSMEHLRECLCWLPTWEQARRLLEELGVGPEQVVQHLTDTQALANGSERLELYRMIAQVLPAGSST